MHGKLFLINGCFITIDNSISIDGTAVGETKEELEEFYSYIMDKGTSPEIELISNTRIILFPRKSVSHFEIYFK